MRIYPLIICCLVSINLASQNLSENEAELLNNLLAESRDTFNFYNKKVAFISGNNGGSIVSKSDYFENLVNPWLEKGDTPQTFMVRLNDEEKIQSGGYDLLVLSWVKVFTPKRKRKVIRALRRKTDNC
ncbi:MAG: hypothetical protein R2879_04385 [Saprospiraceae bacterium]